MDTSLCSQVSKLPAPSSLIHGPLPLRLQEGGASSTSAAATKLSASTAAAAAAKPSASQAAELNSTTSKPSAAGPVCATTTSRPCLWGVAQPATSSTEQPAASLAVTVPTATVSLTSPATVLPSTSFSIVTVVVHFRAAFSPLPSPAMPCAT